MREREHWGQGNSAGQKLKSSPERQQSTKATDFNKNREKDTGLRLIRGGSNGAPSHLGREQRGPISFGPGANENSLPFSLPSSVSLPACLSFSLSLSARPATPLQLLL